MFKISTHLAWIQLYCANNICESHEYSPLHADLLKEEELSMTYVKVMESSSLLAILCGLHTPLHP